MLPWVRHPFQRFRREPSTPRMASWRFVPLVPSSAPGDGSGRSPSRHRRAALVYPALTARRRSAVLDARQQFLTCRTASECSHRAPLSSAVDARCPRRRERTARRSGSSEISPHLSDCFASAACRLIVYRGSRSIELWFRRSTPIQSGPGSLSWTRYPGRLRGPDGSKAGPPDRSSTTRMLGAFDIGFTVCAPMERRPGRCYLRQDYLRSMPSSARLSFSTLTRGSPMTPTNRPSVFASTSWRTCCSVRPRALATRGTWNRAPAGVMSGSRPLAGGGHQIDRYRRVRVFGLQFLGVFLHAVDQRLAGRAGVGAARIGGVVGRRDGLGRIIRVGIGRRRGPAVEILRRL